MCADRGTDFKSHFWGDKNEELHYYRSRTDSLDIYLINFASIIGKKREGRGKPFFTSSLQVLPGFDTWWTNPLQIVQSKFVCTHREEALKLNKYCHFGAKPTRLKWWSVQYMQSYSQSIFLCLDLIIGRQIAGSAGENLYRSIRRRVFTS